MRKTLVSAAVALLFIPVSAGALTADDIAAQIQSLLARIAELQQSLGISSGTATQSSAPIAIDADSCPLVGRTLFPGESGAEVTRLQKYLATDPSVYPEGIVTGYYGALTKSAVSRWQSKNAIDTTNGGYGVFGPRTAAAIALQCAARARSYEASINVGGYIQLSPLSGSVPLRVSAVATVNTPLSCAGAVYLLDWGDGSRVEPITIPPSNCGLLSMTYAHTYTRSGTYSVQLSSGPHTTNATVTVSGGTTTSSDTGTTGFQAESVAASPLSGSAPLTVTFSGVVNTDDEGWQAGGNSFSVIDFGDGAQVNIPLPAQKGNAAAFSVKHTYVSAGSFTAVMYQGDKETAYLSIGNPMTIQVAGGASTGSGGVAQSAEVQMSGSNFSPRTLTVSRGATITWRNTDSMAHTVTADNLSYDSGTLAPGQTYELTLANPGTYTYYCKFHGGPGGSGMAGTIIVN